MCGHVGLDEAADRVQRAAGPQRVAPGDVTLRGFLADLRVAGLQALRLALPVAGDPSKIILPKSMT